MPTLRLLPLAFLISTDGFQTFRSKERRLVVAADEIVTARKAYRDVSPGTAKDFPSELTDLLHDPRMLAEWLASGHWRAQLVERAPQVLCNALTNLNAVSDIPIGSLRRRRRISIYQFIEPYIGADAGPISARSRSITQCFLSRHRERRKYSNKGLALQAQKVLDGVIRPQWPETGVSLAAICPLPADTKIVFRRR